MTRYCLPFLCLAMVTHPVLAQEIDLSLKPMIEEPVIEERGAEIGEFSDTPICSTINNLTDHRIYGSINTATTPTADGIMAHHNANFAIEPGEGQEFCSTGPFFEGGRLELVLRSLFPVFTCQTRLGRPIDVTALRRADDLGYDWSATCY